MLASVVEIAEYTAVHCSDCRRRWKTSQQIYKHILALNEFSQSNFFLQEEGFYCSDCSFIFYCKRACASPTSLCWHVYAQPSRTRKNWTNREVRKKTFLSKTLAFVLATLLDIWTSFCAPSHRRTLTMVYAIRGPAATQATIYYTVWKRSLF